MIVIQICADIFLESNDFKTIFIECLDGSHKAATSQISCLQAQLDSKGRLMSGVEAAAEASRRIDAALALLESDLYKVRIEH